MRQAHIITGCWQVKVHTGIPTREATRWLWMDTIRASDSGVLIPETNICLQAYHQYSNCFSKLKGCWPHFLSVMPQLWGCTSDNPPEITDTFSGVSAAHRGVFSPFFHGIHFWHVTAGKGWISNNRIPFGHAISTVLCKLGNWHDMLGRFNGMEPSLILIPCVLPDMKMWQRQLLTIMQYSQMTQFTKTGVMMPARLIELFPECFKKKWSIKVVSFCGGIKGR